MMSVKFYNDRLGLSMRPRPCS